MSDRKKGDYEVGYGKPPRHSQFAPGQSGNKGRRKRPETRAEIVARLSNEVVEVNGKRVTKFELAMIQTINNTIRSGKPRDTKALLELLDKYGALPKVENLEATREQADAVYNKIMRAFYFEADIDPADVEALEKLQKEEIRQVMSCPHCGPSLREQWARPERKALATRYGKTAFHREVTEPFDKDGPWKHNSKLRNKAAK